MVVPRPATTEAGRWILTLESVGTVSDITSGKVSSLLTGCWMKDSRKQKRRGNCIFLLPMAKGPTKGGLR